MGCLFCGKEIGPLRSLRDNEFCSSVHRNRYKERLDKALHSIAAPEPAPAGIAGFRAGLAPLGGNCSYGVSLSGFKPQLHPIAFRTSCPVSLGAIFGGSMRLLQAPAARDAMALWRSGAAPLGMETRVPGLRLGIVADSAAETAVEPRDEERPPVSSGWGSLPAEAVESAMEWASAAEWNASPAIAFPAGANAFVPGCLQMATAWAALPAAAVESKVEWASEAQWIEAPMELLTAAGAKALVPRRMALATNWAALPAAPVESMVAWASAAQRVEAPMELLTPASAKALAPRRMALATAWAALPASPVESMVGWASAVQWIAASPELFTPEWHTEIAADEAAEQMPPEAAGWANLPPAAVESMVSWARAAQWIAASPELFTPDLDAFATQTASVWATLPAAPVESMVAWASDLRWVEAPAALKTPDWRLEIGADAPAEEIPAAATAWVALPPAAAESVVAPATALQWMVAPIANAVPLGQAVQHIAELGVSLADYVAGPQASEVSSFITASSSPEIPAASAVKGPSLELAVVADELEAVAACDAWMQAPAADPVASLVAWTAASMAPWLDPLAAAPLQWQLAVAPTFIPTVNKLVRPPKAQPTEVAVFPIGAMEPVTVPTFQLRGLAPAFDLALDAASHVRGARPAPVESMPAAQIVEPAAALIAPIVSIFETPLEAAACSYGHSPAEHSPVPVESFVVPSFRAVPIAASDLALPALALASGGRRSALRLESKGDARALPTPQTLPSHSRPAALRPIRRLELVRPEIAAEAPAPAIPERGFAQLEFFCQPPAASASAALGWQDRTVDLVHLPLVMRLAVIDKVEEVVPQKKTGKKPDMAEIFSLPGVRRKASNPALRYAFKAIAASLVMGGVLWFGVGTMSIGNHTPAVNRDVSILEGAAESVPESPAVTVADSPAPKPAAPAAPHGPVARLRQAISDRAAATVTDSFHNGMEAWGTKPKAWAAGWSRHPEGYVQPGQLALFNPSLKYRDYHLEFFGQIDHKSMGWTVRSKDEKNYYAMKFTVVEPGLRPIIAMVHYPVVGGRKGHQLETPLNVMVHNNKPFQVAVDVKGNRVVTSIDGQEVDTWIDDAIAAGGVGFFSEAGEKARLYWMKVSKNEDFLGRICAYVSSKLGDGSNTTAEMWAPEIPGPLPQPGRRVPGAPEEATLAAAVLGMGGMRGRTGLFRSARALHGGSPDDTRVQRNNDWNRRSRRWSS